MRDEDFRRWFKEQKYGESTIETQLSYAHIIEQTYGELDGLYDADGLNGILTELAYSAADKTASQPNPSKLKLWGDTYRDLARLRFTISYYQRFRQGTTRIRKGLSPPNREAVEKAMDECSEVGVLSFMEAYGFSWTSLEHYATRDALPYPSKAIFAVAHQYMPSGVPLDHDSCNGTEAHQHLASLGFEILKRPPLLLFDKEGQTYEVVMQTNSQTGSKAYRYKPTGASNRTDDAVETRDLIEVARALFVNGFAVRIARAGEGVANYLIYPGRTFSGHWLRPDISIAIGMTSASAGRPISHRSTRIMSSEPTNIILHGPPGTGKTWRTAYEAVRLCDGFAPEDRRELMARYQALEAEKRIVFVTFHQSMDYESFVEGLRPETEKLETEELEIGSAGFRLEPLPGIFREICSLAEQARLSRPGGGSLGVDLDGRQFWKMGLGTIGAEDDVYEGAINGNYVVLGWGGDVDWSDKRFADPAEVEQEWKAEAREDNSPSNYKQLWTFRSKMQKRDIVIVPYGNSAFRAVAEVQGDYQYVPGENGVYNHRREVRWLLKLREPLPLDTIVQGKFTMRTLYSIPETRLNKAALRRLLANGQAPEHQPPNAKSPDQFVLIIDEINRANVSKVLGELITLIEPDKRLGQRNKLVVVLPYSRRPFGVPDNLHIIGTMNTADRSIALLDTALRRRFRFIEVAPNPQVLAEAAKQTGIRLVEVLTAMNDRIEYLVDRDHKIGHAFLVDCQSRDAVDQTFRDKVIPLLQEYFFEDWSKVAVVLGERTDRSGSDYHGAFLGCRRLRDPTGEGGPDRLSWYVLGDFAEDAYERLIRGFRPEMPVDAQLLSEDV